MIRIILIAVFVVSFLILSIPLFFIEWIIGKFNPSLRDISSLRIVQWAFKVVILLSGVKLTVIGEENIPKDTAVLFIGNHRSYFDIVLTYARCRGLTGYVAKKEMLKIPLLSRWMKFLHCLFLDRSDVREGLKTILTAIDKVKSGISIMIFPEGTRNKNESELDLLPFHEGSFKIATKSGCPIIPVSINNSSALFEDHLPYVKKAPVIIEYGEPIYVKELPKEQQKFVGRYVQDIIVETLKKNKSALTES
ncbi:MAG: 1-acyl-sn-glycerol-3-phosphate acyltransferase [Lachnospiraceae bacterium]|nr:1-acyl-sn-glycerol-3-phosphate acyltransferase [Lachnospiraceae bacterium]MDD7077100.1 lysophospholipid acyltransferase family protein [Lachnospiraceae bacterium]MDY3729980.1 lysophospholipid acyltransferase family protein [Candidatus Choladocola sp.]